MITWDGPPDEPELVMAVACARGLAGRCAPCPDLAGPAEAFTLLKYAAKISEAE